MLERSLRFDRAEIEHKLSGIDCCLHENSNTDVFCEAGLLNAEMILYMRWKVKFYKN